MRGLSREVDGAEVGKAAIFGLLVVDSGMNVRDTLYMHVVGKHARFRFCMSHVPNQGMRATRLIISNLTSGCSCLLHGNWD